MELALELSMGWPMALVTGVALVWALGPVVVLALAMVLEALVLVALALVALALATELEELEAHQPLLSQL